MHHAVTYYLGRTPEGAIEVVSFDDYKRPRVGSTQEQLFLSVKRRSDGSTEMGDPYYKRHLLVYRLEGKERGIALLWNGAEIISDTFKKALIQYMTNAADNSRFKYVVFDGLTAAAKLLGFLEELELLKACCAKVRIKKIPPPRPKEK
jgi:hypothetical protein